VHSDTFHRQNVQRSAVISCKRDMYACFFPSRLSKFDCNDQPVHLKLELEGYFKVCVWDDYDPVEIYVTECLQTAYPASKHCNSLGFKTLLIRKNQEILLSVYQWPKVVDRVSDRQKFGGQNTLAGIVYSFQDLGLGLGFGFRFRV
jgi:hypothetical protein